MEEITTEGDRDNANLNFDNHCVFKRIEFPFQTRKMYKSSVHLAMTRRTGNELELLIYSKTVETSYLRDLLVAVAVSVVPWELRAFMVPINKPFNQYEMHISFHFLILILGYFHMVICRISSVHVSYKISFPKKIILI